MRFGHCAASPSSLIRMRFRLPSVQRAPKYPSWEMRLIYPLCSGPLITRERGGLPSVQRALHPSWEMGFTQCAVGPSSLLREEVYLVCNGPIICTLEREGLPSVQCAPHPWLCLRYEVYPVCSGPLIIDSAWEIRFRAYPVCNQPLIPERWSSPSVHPASHPWLGLRVNPLWTTLSCLSYFNLLMP